MRKLIVKRLTEDGFDRPRIRNIVNSRIYVNVDLKEDLNSKAWHTCSEDGEPECPLASDIELVLFKDTAYYKENNENE